MGLYKREIELRAKGFDALKIFLLESWVSCCNLLLTIISKFLFKKLSADVQSSKHVLVFRTGSIGDSVCALPAIAAINKYFKDASITILTNGSLTNQLSLTALLQKKYFHHAIDYSSLNTKQLLYLLKEKKFDIVIQLPQQHASIFKQIRDMFFFKLAGVKYGFGWKKTSTLLFKKVQEQYIVQSNEAETLLGILKENGIAYSGEIRFPLAIEENDEVLVLKLLAESGISINDQKLAAIVIGAKRVQNRWPLNYFKEVVQFLVNSSFKVILIGGKDDYSNAQTLTGNNVFNFCGKLSTLQSAAILAVCNFCISNDTGPMHLAYAVDTPVLSIFSSRDFPGRWFPPANKVNKVFRSNNISCSLCLSENCTDNICMKAI